MKKITYLLILLLAFNFGYSQTTLSAGDIAITGFNSDDPDEFTFVLLTDVTNTTTIKFTDNGWINSGSFRANEGIITWTATSDLPCGTEIIISEVASNTYSSSYGIANETDLGFLLSVSGDQILAYQGAEATPTFIYAIHFNGSSGWSANATSPNTSALPTGLTNGVNAIAINHVDNAKYNCSVIYNSALILAAVSDSNNWIGSNAIIPLGGCSYTCGNCPTVVTWDGTSWDAPPTATTFAIIDGNYTATTANSFSACSLYINEVSSSTSNPVIVTVDNGGFIEVENDVIVDGTLIVETQGNFVQRGSTGTFNLNTGLGAVARVNKSTAAKSAWYFYTYWSSPVIGETIADAFPNVDGDRRFWFNAANFVDTNGDDIDDNGDDWQYALGGDIMTPGAGYAVTESRLFIPPPGPGGASGTASFEGPFNTNDVDVSISENAANVAAGSTSWNFIGNPYPSAIDFDAFYAANSTVVGGAAYFWSQVSAPNTANAGNENFNFNKNDYAIYTVGSGSIVAGAGGIIPDQYIPSGQGFFIAGIDNNTATFTNAMRMADDTSNNQFFRNSNSKKKTSNPNTNKLWVNLTTDNGVFSQILLAYVDGATNGNDGLSYDAPKIVNQDFAAILYSSMDSDNKKYVIQGKDINSINEDEIINLGFSSTIQTTTQYNLSIAQIEGDFLTSNTVYLKDNLLGTLHNLSDSDYTFTSEVGEFNTRFEIVFNANALSTEDLALENNTLKIIELEDDRVQFTTSSNIKAVRIYDLLGRQLYNFKGQSNSETYKLSNLSSTIYIAKVELLNGATITKKAFKK